ncbi:BfmA/BtgA family mobilization protein [Gelidibacter mesophilus]|uniref:BfmA/BtgA family mobilization protein n=1 Tax=Gelidibacter mesophilus TaxID=169050 RepID=UPI00042162FF|nr:BfmA/BtgA family mobilization protein [Gelidibacter mesophilus]
MKSKPQNTTTISLSISDNQRLTAWCHVHSIAKKEFVSIILNYLEVNGVNPKVHNVPKTELEKMNKRINQFFAFIKTQEKEYLRPALEAIVATERSLKSDIKNLVIKSDLNKFSDSIDDDNIADLITETNTSEIKKILDKLNRIEKNSKEFQEAIQADVTAIKNKRRFSI